MNELAAFYSIIILIIISIGLLAKYGEQSLLILFLAFFLLVGASFINIYIY